MGKSNYNSRKLDNGSSVTVQRRRDYEEGGHYYTATGCPLACGTEQEVVNYMNRYNKTGSYTK